ncbi:M1-specific T cell receptor beta chain [Brienomyrus brachyistius]|uniref:M1-specific T cell receptor beta chain n=1 Tax=Brienomyrus brachyistius TaxID=42636 RepID=UPI0020B1C7A9|nr:M1-specific T cell receptor beta chain [Brienomyrus brachyistius]
MFTVTGGFGFALILIPCLITGIKFEQPANITANLREEVEIHCSHSDSSYLYMFWYKQERDGVVLLLITYAYGTSDAVNEGNFSKSRFELKKTANEKGTLTIRNLTAADSAKYFCAASKHSAADSQGHVAKTLCKCGGKTKRLTDGIKIVQPEFILTNLDKEAEIQCSHDDANYDVMLWYKQEETNTALLLIGYGYSTVKPEYEEKFKTRFTLRKSAAEKGSLNIKNLTVADSAIYFFFYCDNANPAYFGDGTKLTVLDSDVTQPKVKVLNPSEKEICTRRKKVTLVCVVTDFYPDHIEVYWQQNGANITYGHKTDDRALQYEKGKFSITSRLRISLQKWYNLRNSFTCMASFFNGYNNYTTHSHTINGARGDVLQKGDIISRSQWAKLSYGALVAKSVLYGIFIFIVVWKLKGSGAKK